MSGINAFFFSGKPNVRPLTVTHPNDLDQRETFLANLRHERERNDRDKRNEQLAVGLQAIVRGFLARRRYQKHIRATYAELSTPNCARRSPSVAHVCACITQLCKFYDADAVDDTRLMTQLCHTFIAVHNATKATPPPFDQAALRDCHRRRFLSCLVRQMRSSHTDVHRMLPVELRVYELTLFVDAATVKWAVGSDDCAHYTLLQSLYERTVRAPLNNQWQRETTAGVPGHTAEHLYELMTRPLLVYAADDATFVCDAHQAFMSALFNVARLSPAFVCHILPQMCIDVAGGRLSADHFVDALIAAKASTTVTPHLSYCLLELLSRAPPPSPTGVRMQCLVAVCPPLLQWLDAEYDDVDRDDDDDDAVDERQLGDGEQPMEIATMTHASKANVNSRAALLSTCLRHIQSPWLTQLLHTAVGAARGDTAGSMALCPIAYVLMRIGQTTGGRMAPLFYTLGFQHLFIRRLLQQIKELRSATKSRTSILLLMAHGERLSLPDAHAILPPLSLFCLLLRNVMLAVDDDEFYIDAAAKPTTSLMPFCNTELAIIAEIVRDCALGLVTVAYVDEHASSSMFGGSAASRDAREDARLPFMTAYKQERRQWVHLFDIMTAVQRQLHERDSRVHFCASPTFWHSHGRPVIIERQIFRSAHARSRHYRTMTGHGRAHGNWLSRDAFGGDSAMDDDPASTSSAPSNTELRNVTIIRRMPFVVPFTERVSMLQQLIVDDKQSISRADGWGGGPNVIECRVRRTHLYEDAFDRLNDRNAPDLRHQVRVQMTNWSGLDEAGIDGGGLFREFLSETVKVAFEPQRGLFCATNAGDLYPNPLATTLYPGDEWVEHFYFLGRLIGKLIYEQQLAEMHFASFFLAKLQRLHTNVDVNHLRSFDAVLARTISQLKWDTDSNIDDMNLDFSVCVETLGAQECVELKPNGRHVRVTGANKLEYIQLLADFYLNKQIRPMVAAFRRGVSQVLHIDWLRMFDHRELQMLIGGVNDEIDIEDMRAHTRIDSPSQSIVDERRLACTSRFWRCVDRMTGAQRQQLLKFITGCSRPPLMGFKELFPPLHVQLTPDETRLPTASTCMNLLKLPAIGDDDAMFAKIVCAIESGAGFELS